MRSDELPSPDCPPLRVKLLGEDLIAFRTTSGDVGLIAERLPPPRRLAVLRPQRRRGPALRLPRLEVRRRRRLRRHAVRARREQLQDQGARAGLPDARARRHHLGLHGPARSAAAAARPRSQHADRGRTHRSTIIHRQCNWMQGWEGEMDTVHAAFLHCGATNARGPGARHASTTTRPSSAHATLQRPRDRVRHRLRRLPPGRGRHLLLAHRPLLFPFYAMIPHGHAGPGRADRRLRADGRRPHDALGDLHQPGVLAGFGAGSGGAGDVRSFGQDKTEIEKFIEERRASNVITGPALRPGQLPNGTGWFDRFNIEQNLDNDYLIDREAQRTGKSYTGIPGIRQQDMAVTETHGPDLRALPRAPRHDRRDDHPHAPQDDRRRQGPARSRASSRPASTTRRSTASAPARSSSPATSTGGTPQSPCARSSR